MRKIIVTEFITPNGVVEAPGGDETHTSARGWQAKHSSHPEIGQYVATDVAALKQTEGGNILAYGSATLVQSPC